MHRAERTYDLDGTTMTLVFEGDDAAALTTAAERFMRGRGVPPTPTLEHDIDLEAFTAAMEHHKEAANLSWREVSRACGLVSHHTIIMWRKGIACPSSAPYLKVCAWMDRDPYEFLVRELA